MRKRLGKALDLGQRNGMGRSPSEERELARFAREISAQEKNLRRLEERLDALKGHYEAARKATAPAPAKKTRKRI